MTQSREFEFGGNEVGGGGLTKYDATVGTADADYLDVQAAITGVGGTDIKLLMITDVTEDSDIAVPAGTHLVLDLSSYALTMGVFDWDINDSTTRVHIFGNGMDSGAEIDYTKTASYPLFLPHASTVLRLENFVIDNNSTAVNCRVANSGIQLFHNLRVELPNYSTCGFEGAQTGSMWTNITMVGGGAACQKGMKCSSNEGQLISDIIFRGQFHATAQTLDMQAGCTVYNVLFYPSTNAAMVTLVSDARVIGLHVIGAQAVDVECDGDNCSLINANLNGGNVDVFSRDFVHLDNVVTTGALDMTGAPLNNIISNCKFDGALTVAGDDNKFSNVEIGSTFVVSGDNNQFSNVDVTGEEGVTVSGDNNKFSNAEFASTLIVTGDSNRFSDVDIVGAVTVSAIGNMFVGCEVASMDLDDSTYTHLSHVISAGILDLTEADGGHHTIDGCSFIGALTVAGDFNKFSNSEFSADVTINDGADDNGFSNCEVPTGGTTITIVAGALRTRVFGSVTDLLIVDGGTATELCCNTVLSPA